MQACCGCGLGSRAGVRGPSVREFVGAWLSARGRRAIWTASGPRGQFRSSAAPAAPGLSAGVLAAPLPAGAGGFLVPEAAGAFPSAASTTRASPLWPTRQTGELPGRPRQRVLNRFIRKERALRSHASQPSPACPVSELPERGLPRSPQCPRSLLCGLCRSEPLAPEDECSQRVPAVTHPLSLLRISAASLQPAFQRWTQDSPGRSSDAPAASNSVNRFAQGIRYALKGIRPRGGEGP